MKIIGLNINGGRVGWHTFEEFFTRYHDVDIFCFQEMINGGEKLFPKVAQDLSLDGVEYQLWAKTQNFLFEHKGFFRPAFYNFFGQAILIKNTWSISGEGEWYVYQKPGYASSTMVGDYARNCSYVTFKTGKGLRTVINVHCLWDRGGKEDTSARLQQSAKIIEFTNTLDHPYIIIGDFNLEPNTESLKMLENQGLRNLIVENNIQSTRTPLYTKPGKFADYALVSKGIVVNDFRVLPDILSDHSPLYLDCV